MSQEENTANPNPEANEPEASAQTEQLETSAPPPGDEAPPHESSGAPSGEPIPEGEAAAKTSDAHAEEEGHQPEKVKSRTSQERQQLASASLHAAKSVRSGQSVKGSRHAIKSKTSVGTASKTAVPDLGSKLSIKSSGKKQEEGDVKHSASVLSQQGSRKSEQGAESGKETGSIGHKDEPRKSSLTKDVSKQSVHSDRKSSVVIHTESRGGLPRVGPSDGDEKSATSLRKSRSTISSKEGGRDHMSSRARIALGSIISIRRSSMVGDLYDKKAARYANTYKLDSDRPFKPEVVKGILENVMNEAIESLTSYDGDKCPKQAKWASSAIRAKLKELDFERYKLICLVTIGEKNSQDVYVTCRFLWDADRDRYATYSLENTYVFGIAQCFGLYYE